MPQKSHNELIDSKEIALAKLKKYCAYQDRCHQEVRFKLLTLKIYGEDLEEIITELIKEDYLNEERFARSYARGKFRIKKWGRNRIIQELKRRKVSDYCIRKGLGEIEENEYKRVLLGLIKKESHKHQNIKEYQRRSKLYNFGLRKGYESSLINEAIHELVQNEDNYETEGPI